MNKVKLMQKLVKINEGITILLDPKSEFNKHLERTEGMDLILSQDIHSLIQTNAYLNKMEETKYKDFFLSVEGLKNYPPEERIKSGIKEIWRRKTKKLRLKYTKLKKEDEDMKTYIFRRFNFINWILFTLVIILSFLPIGIFLVLSLFLDNLILIPGLIITCYFFIWNTLSYTKYILWR